MNATTHPVVPEEIMAFLDGELSADRTQFVSTHVAECSGCRETQDSIQKTRQSIAQWTFPSVPAQMEEHLRQAEVALRGLTEDNFLGSLRRFLRRRQTLAWGGAAFTALLIFLGVSSARHETDFSYYTAPSPRTRAVQHQATSGRGGLDKLQPQAATRDIPVDNASIESRGAVDGDDYVARKIPLQASTPAPASHPQHLEDWQSAPMIAHTVSLSIVVKEFETSHTALDAILARHKGYAASLNVSTPQDAARALQASLRIPAPQLASALAELKALGRVEVETQNGEEVTQQHADLVARLKNSRETEQRLQDVLRTRTGKVKDVLEVEQEIARVRGEIEQMEAEQKTLEHRVDFATIDLRLAEEYKAQLSSPAPSVLIQLRNATVNGFRNAFESFLGIVLFFAESGPTLILWLAILSIPAWLLWRRYRRAHALGSLVGA
jgi:hypothetical protein